MKYLILFIFFTLSSNTLIAQFSDSRNYRVSKTIDIPRIGLIFGANSVAYSDSKANAALSDGFKYRGGEISDIFSDHFYYGFESRFANLKSETANVDYHFNYNEYNAKIGVLFKSGAFKNVSIIPKYVYGLRNSNFEFIDKTNNRKSEEQNSSNSLFNQEIHAWDVSLDINLRFIYFTLGLRGPLGGEPLKIKYVSEEGEISDRMQIDLVIGFIL